MWKASIVMYFDGYEAIEQSESKIECGALASVA